MAETIITSEIETLVSEGNTALIAGDAYTARQRFRRVLELDPERVEAWIGLAGSVRPYREKREHLRRALEIDPSHATARSILEQVEARLAAGQVLAPGGVQVRESEPTLLSIARTEEAAAFETTLAESEASSDEVETLFCYNHSDRETGLRCTNCNQPICSECATPAIVGQLCPTCLKIRRPVNYQVSEVNLLVAGATALIYSLAISFVAVQLLGMVGFFGFLLAFFLGPLAGNLLVRLSDRFTKGKRGRLMQIALGICYTLGALPWLGLTLIFGVLPLGLIIFTVMAVTTVVAQMR
ncbi:hypothetical protein EYB53_013755 [Candidatus Chloroploca sp. M-50]|uniref:Tetratricopeptide repeat protein n=1 Tax=Candidatus Chloroploca mongolica TaxID=2528176 RepID=A0ABS4DBG1_9CHLR|nr:hypothetical protein [Candidatus Chloroploca mongolica]MBP1466775.1 hypothetical protein [Candidatus Chloroploca mongolica]